MNNGNVGIGTTAPTPGSALEIVGLGTGASSLIIPRDSTANRPVTAASVNGMMRYNTNTNSMEGFVNGSWQSFAIGAGVGTVQNITTGAGLLGGSIVSTGTISANVGTGVGQLVQEQTGGQIQQNIGTAGAPAYSFVGDTGNGFFKSGSGNFRLGDVWHRAVHHFRRPGKCRHRYDHAPQAALDVTATGTASSFILVPRDTTANRPVAAASVNGAIRYNTNNNALESFVNGRSQDVAVALAWVRFKTSRPELGSRVEQLIRLEQSL